MQLPPALPRQRTTPDTPAQMAARVRTAAQGFDRRRAWVLAFAVGMVGLVLNDLLHLNYLMLAIDAVVAWSLVSLYRSVHHFRTAARTGALRELHAGSLALASFLRLSVISAVLALLGLAVIVAVVIWSLDHAQDLLALSPGVRAEVFR